MADKKSKNKKDKDAQETPIWEWIIAAIGLVLVFVVIGSALHRAVIEDSTPPLLEFTVEAVKPAANGYLVEFLVKNTGNQTAAALAVEGQLKKGEEVVETSTVTLTYAPARSVRQGGLYFMKNPNEFELQIRALGYEKP